jgi:hypothetical protein
LRLFAVAVEGGLVAIMVSAMSLSAETMKYLWFFFGLSISLGRMASREWAVSGAGSEARGRVAPPGKHPPAAG